MLWLLLSLRYFPSCDSVRPSEGHPGWRESSVLLTTNESKRPETSWVLRTFALGWARDTPVKKQCFSEVGLWETRCIMSMGTGHEVWTLGVLANSKREQLSLLENTNAITYLYIISSIYIYLHMYSYSCIYISAMWLTGGNSRKVLRAATHARENPVNTICSHRFLYVTTQLVVLSGEV